MAWAKRPLENVFRTKLFHQKKFGRPLATRTHWLPAWTGWLHLRAQLPEKTRGFFLGVGLASPALLPEPGHSSLFVTHPAENDLMLLHVCMLNLAQIRGKNPLGKTSVGDDFPSIIPITAHGMIQGKQAASHCFVSKHLGGCLA